MIDTSPVEKQDVLKGAEFLIKDSNASMIYSPEDITEEQKMFKDMAREFISKEIHPNVQKLDKHDWDLAVALLDKAGELGLLGASVPEEYGGMGVDFNTDSYLAEEMGQGNAFGVSVAAHSGIGTLPILYYGTEEQKQKYLPGIASGKLKAAYCLTEPGSGSDALAAKTKATLTEDGEYYIIEGQKMWITNAGFADIFTVFAQIDGDKFTGFIVPADAENVSLGSEEDKLGIKGSSTRQVFFEGVKVPKENILGEIGKGAKIAFNTLNIGRFKLCAMVMGGCKRGISEATAYANDRIQFGVPISSFGAIKNKIGEMAIKTWVTESATYRTSGLIKDRIDALVLDGADKVQAKLQAADEYSVECAILKVLGSEAVDYIVDEAVQILGGNGFSEEFSASRAYRDARINRIFEGTNEINRLLAVGMTMKKAMKGEIDLMSPVMALRGEMSSPDFGKNEYSGYFSVEKKAITHAKKSILLVLGTAVQKYQNELEKEQEVVMNISDMMISVFTAESALLRAEKIMDLRGEENSAIYIDIAKSYLADTLDNLQKWGKDALAYFSDGDTLVGYVKGLRLLTKYDIFNTIAAKRRVAEHVISANSYDL